MSDFFSIMWKPMLACVLLAGIHAYLGLHVIKRGVIFVDLALAQIAALGAASGFLFGFDLHSAGAYLFSLAAALAGAMVLSLLRMKKENLPQEVLIGIIYAAAAAASVLVLSRAPEGDEHIRHMLVGNILLVSGRDLVKMALLYAAVGLIHVVYRSKFILISENSDEARNRGISVRRWDFIFYATFALVVTSSVEIAGVLLVFSFLIVPAAAAFLLRDRMAGRLMTAWLIGFSASAAGMAASFYLDLPAGAAVVCVFALLFFAVLFWKKKPG